MLPVTSFLFILSIVLAFFLGYHLWLVTKNLTTNEANKRDNLKHAIREENRILLRDKQERRNKNASIEEEEEKDLLVMPPHAYDLGTMRNVKQILWSRTDVNEG